MKSLKATRVAETLFKYSIDEDSAMSLHHVMFSVFFADLTKYCNKLKQSISFCKLSSTESLEDVKKKDAIKFLLSSEIF